MARLYTNENVALPVVQHLRSLGHDVLTSHEAGNANQAVLDQDVLRFANEAGRILMTNNRRDFLVLHRSGQPHCGLILFTVDADFRDLADRIHESTKHAMSGRSLIRVNRDGYSLDSN